jgi:rubrerythrin
LDLTVEEDIEIEEEENEQDGIEEEEDEGNTKEENPFSSLKKSYATKLQDIIEALNLNTEEGVQKILSSNQFDKELIQQLMDKLGISEDTARSFIDDWRKAHEELKRQKLKAKTKFKGMEAIWHCAVCGRGGHPQPVCYVAPYISGYRSVPI